MIAWALLCALSGSARLASRAHADPSASAVEAVYVLQPAAEAAWRSRAVDIPPSKSGPAASLSTFRVRSTLDTDAHTLFALFMDTDRMESWAFGVSEARWLSRLTKDADLLYLYSDTPWPVRDRDMVVVRVSELSPDGQAYRILWHCLPDSAVRERKHVVRVRSCQSEFLLRRIDADSTQLEYRVSIDPAGALPGWARRWFAKQAPGETLARIVEQVKDLEQQRAR